MEDCTMNIAQYQSSYRAGMECLTELRRRNQVLFTIALVHLVLAVLFTALIQLDGRMLLGRNVWTKPWKFATSIMIFTATIGWILPSLSLGDRTERLVSSIVGATMLIEITLISTQAARGVPSHFNMSTPHDTVIFGIMGSTITINTLVIAYVLWRIFRSPPALTPAYLWGLRVGMFVFVVASFEGWLMAALGTHSVGVAVDSAGLPLLNWKVMGGDLRIAHFIGLHALKVLPLAGYVASTRDSLSVRQSLSVLGIVTMLYSSLTIITFVQAIRGVPLVSSIPTVSMSGIFSASFLLVAPFWLLMILAPTWDGTERVMASRLVLLPAALLYLVLLVPVAPRVARSVLNPSLTGMTTLLSTDFGATLAWIHFLAFDLFVGRWVYRDARQRGVSALIVSPILVLTLLFGPVGVVSYAVIRSVTTEQ